MRIIGELLILFFLLLTNLRVLFVKREKKDSIVVLAPFSLLLVVIQIFSWGLDFLNAYILLLSLLVILTNFHALFRYSEKLYIDHYSGFMMLGATLTTLLTLFGIAVAILFFPGHFSGKKLGITESKHYYEGSFRTEFSEKTLFGKTNAVIYEFVPEISDDDSEQEHLQSQAQTQSQSFVPQKTLLLIPDKRSDTEFYESYLQMLASKGYRVYSADFFVKDSRWTENHAEIRFSRQFLLILYQLFGKYDLYSQKKLIEYNTTQEIEAAFSILQRDFDLNEPVFLITDEMTAPAGNLYKFRNPARISGGLNLASVSGYKTPGYGFIAFNNPLLAKILGISKDKDADEIEAVVDETMKAVEAAEKK